MVLTTTDVRETVRLLDEIVEEYKQLAPERMRDWRTYEQRLAKRVQMALAEFRPLIAEIAAVLKHPSKNGRGQKRALSVE